MSLFRTVDKTDGMHATLEYLDVRYKPNHRGWQKVRCPFTENHRHGDKNPSASVNLAEGVFTCHACGEHGDWARVLLEIEGIKINEAVKLLELETDGETNADPTEGGLFLY